MERAEHAVADRGSRPASTWAKHSEIRESSRLTVESYIPVASASDLVWAHDQSRLRSSSSSTCDGGFARRRLERPCRSPYVPAGGADPLPGVPGPEGLSGILGPGLPAPIP